MSKIMGTNPFEADSKRYADSGTFHDETVGPPPPPPQQKPGEGPPSNLPHDLQEK